MEPNLWRSSELSSSSGRGVREEGDGAACGKKSKVSVLVSRTREANLSVLLATNTAHLTPELELRGPGEQQVGTRSEARRLFLLGF